MSKLALPSLSFESTINVKNFLTGEISEDDAYGKANRKPQKLFHFKNIGRKSNMYIYLPLQITITLWSFRMGQFMFPPTLIR